MTGRAERRNEMIERERESTVGIRSPVGPHFPKVELECFTKGVEVYRKEVKLQSLIDTAELRSALSL